MRWAFAMGIRVGCKRSSGDKDKDVCRIQYGGATMLGATAKLSSTEKPHTPRDAVACLQPQPHAHSHSRMLGATAHDSTAK